MEIKDWVSIITGIVSIVLAIVSLIISFVFYRWSDRANMDTNFMSKDISEKTNYLGKLFDKMFDSTFSLVREESEAMRKHLFKSGDVGSVAAAEGDKFIDIVAFMREDGRTIDDICSKFGISREATTTIIKRLEAKKLIYEKDGRYFFFISASNMDESDDS